MNQILIFFILIILSTIVSIIYLVLGLVFHITLDNSIYYSKKHYEKKVTKKTGKELQREQKIQSGGEEEREAATTAAQEEKDKSEEQEEEEQEVFNEERAACVLRFVVMLLCPVVGPAFFLLGQLLYRTVFRKDVDLADVIFSKERVRTNVRADEERERDIVPVEEALAVSDKSSLRSLMLNVIRGDVQSSLAAIALALNSEDSETAHYAASVLQDQLNDFRFHVQKTFQKIEKEEEGKTGCEEELIPYMNKVLEQRVFTDIEQQKLVLQMSQVGEYLFQKDRSKMTSQFYEWICLRLLDTKEFKRMELWCDRAAEQYPEELSSFTCKLKLYFTSNQKEKFFKTMQELKESEVVIDSETLELIRTFG